MMYEVVKASGEFGTKLKNLEVIEGDFYYNYETDILEYDVVFEFENLDEAKIELAKHTSEIEFEQGNRLENGHFEGKAVSWMLIDEDGNVLDFAPLKAIRWEITDEKYDTTTISNKEYTDYFEAIKDCLEAAEEIEEEYRIFFE